jgi:hypothetical protein
MLKQAQNDDIEMSGFLLPTAVQLCNCPFQPLHEPFARGHDIRATVT